MVSSLATLFAMRSSRSSASICVGLCSTGLLIVLIYYLVHIYNAQHGLSDVAASTLAAVILEAVALICIVALIIAEACWPEAFARRSNHRLILAAVITTVLTPGMVLSIISIAHVFSASSDGGRIRRRLHASDTLPEVCYAIWVIALLLQIVLLTLCFWSRKEFAPPEHVVEDDVDHSLTTVTTNSDQKKSNSIEMGNLRPSGFPSPPAAARRSVISTTSSHKSSLRKSVQQILHPQSSRTRLIRQPSSRTRLIRQPSSQSISDSITPRTSLHRQPDAFDTWEVDPRALEPIPGSRPASPAKALDGPYPLEDEDRGYTSFPDPVLPSPTTHTFHNAGSIRSRSASVTSEAHIHPLFRSDSPLPPPLASPGTIVTASQWGGQVVSPTDRDRAMSLSRTISRSSSRPASPGLPMSSWIRSGSRAGSRAGSVSGSISGGRVPLRSVKSDERMVAGRAVVRRQQSFYT